MVLVIGAGRASWGAVNAICEGLVKDILGARTLVVTCREG